MPAADYLTDRDAIADLIADARLIDKNRLHDLLRVIAWSRMDASKLAAAQDISTLLWQMASKAAAEEEHWAIAQRAVETYYSRGEA